MLCKVFPGGLVVKNLPAMHEMQVRFLDQEDPLEKEMATHCSIFAWEIPQTEELGWLQSMAKELDMTYWLNNKLEQGERDIGKKISWLYMEFQRHRGRVLRLGEGGETESVKKIYRSFRNENVGPEEWPGNLGYLVVTELCRMRLVQRASGKTLPLRLCSCTGKSGWLARNTEECRNLGIS